MSNQNEGEFSGVIFVSSGPSLEERVTALEKQLSVMQAAMSCNINALSSRVSDVELKAN
ncbi:hypothetical protein [Providencia rettgeri]